MTHDSRHPDDEQDEVPLIQLRVPGPWEEPAELVEALERSESGWRVDSDGELMLVHDETGRRVSCGVTPHDDELGDVFRGGHAGRLSDEELDQIEAHAVKIHIETPGGSAEAAQVAVEAAAALVRAGGVGVFVDNSGACHGPDDFLKLADPSDPGGLYWAFVILSGNQDEIWSSGMHCLGLRDCRLPDPPDDPNLAAFAIHNFLGYTFQSGATVTDGDLLHGPHGPLFRAFHESCDRFLGSPMHNPYGMWRLEPVDNGIGSKGPPM